MIEKYVITDGPDKGRISDIGIADELAETEYGWRDDNGGIPMNRPPERLGKSEVRFRELLDEKLTRLIIEDITTKAMSELDDIYSTETARLTDPEENDEGWLRYRIVNRLATLGEEYGFDDQTCQELLELPLPVAFNCIQQLYPAGLKDLIKSANPTA